MQAHMRRLAILHALVDEYVHTAEPVGSKTLVEHYNLGVSSATVRNDLATLEQEGFVFQPHTSAGRIPTDAGYRTIVDQFLAQVQVKPESHAHHLAWRPQNAGIALSDLLQELASFVSRKTKSYVVASEPQRETLVIERVSLTLINAAHVVIVLIAQDGRVRHKTLEVQAYLPEMTQVTRIEQALNTVLQGVSRAQILSASKNHPWLANPLAGAIVSELIDLCASMQAITLHQEGMSTLLQQPEFAQPHTSAEVLDALDDESSFIREVIEASSNNLMICIGTEHQKTHGQHYPSLDQMSVLSIPYTKGDAQGIIAVIGPKRMNYQHAISALWAAADALDDASNSIYRTQLPFDGLSAGQMGT